MNTPLEFLMLLMMMIMIIIWYVLALKEIAVFGQGTRAKQRYRRRIVSFEEKSRIVNGYVATWDDAVIPYYTDCSIENLPYTMEAIRAAMKQWESKTCIRFVQKTNEPYFLHFFRGSHCWGNVGRYSKSAISVGPNCDYENIMAHEIGHAVGMFHEQNRRDRNNWVKINWEKIPPSERGSYRIIKSTARLKLDYDYGSIMHYPWSTFYSGEYSRVMSPLRNPLDLQPYMSISKTDIALTSMMYNCSDVMRKRNKQIKYSSFRHYATTTSKFDKHACVDQSLICGTWSKNGLCHRSKYARQHCSRSCKSSSCYGSDCIDKFPNCVAWGKQGYCNSRTLVQTECQLTCNPTCLSQGCIDTHPKCERWVRTGKCSVDEKTRALCPKGCGTPFCMDQRPSPSPKTKRKRGEEWPNRNYLGTGMQCRDKRKSCPKRARLGQCETIPKWMLKNCLNSCPKASCDRKLPRPSGKCNNPLGLSAISPKAHKLPDSAFQASSEFNAGGWIAGAANARLYFEDDYRNRRIGSWCASRSSRSYIQVDLQRVRTIAYIATQGRDNAYQRVSRFKIQHSRYGRYFMTYREHWRDRIFYANCDHVTPVLNKFKRMIRARFIRVLPLSWNWPCLRMELYGC